nr:FAD-binding protein [Sulfurovaceae bacterium]
IYADNIIIASGGVGSLYQFNTNSRAISADIHGICVEKGIPLADMEMMQFHPTVFVKTPYARKLLLTEALRGEGAFIVNEKGERFLFNYDNRGELASRDIVSRAIFDYKRKHNNEDVYLDFSMFGKEFFHKRFPNITRSFSSLGYAFPEDRVPISPAFHYAVGGIKSNTYGKVYGITNLFAIGEASSTGVHGANRLASNSLLEGLVFAKRSIEYILSQKNKDYEIPSFDINYGTILHKENDKEYRERLRSIMWHDIGIIRTKDGLRKAKNLIYDMKNQEIGRLLELRLNTASAIVESALARDESLGAHYME